MKKLKSQIIFFTIIFVASIYYFRYRIIYFPKPYGYERIELPIANYKSIKNLKFPYSFEISSHAYVVLEDKKKYGPYCITIKYPTLKNAVIQITYKNYNKNKEQLRDYIKNVNTLAYMHKVKATEIKNKIIKTNTGQPVVIFELSGHVPTPIQFYTIDNDTHFIRAAVYFETSTENEYLKPIIDFIKNDIFRMIETLQWEKD